jgi:hypothetical protein
MLALVLMLLLRMERVVHGVGRGGCHKVILNRRGGGSGGAHVVLNGIRVHELGNVVVHHRRRHMEIVVCGWEDH